MELQIPLLFPRLKQSTEFISDHLVTVDGYHCSERPRQCLTLSTHALQ